MSFMTNTTFLVVEDDPSIRAALVSDLKSIGVKGEIFEGENGKKGFEQLVNYYPTAYRVGFIITDINMPIMNGLEFLKKARSSLYAKSLPILMLTTEADNKIVMEAITSGVSNYLLKPWKKEDLKSKLEACWKKHNTEA